MRNIALGTLLLLSSACAGPSSTTKTPLPENVVAGAAEEEATAPAVAPAAQSDLLVHFAAEHEVVLGLSFSALQKAPFLQQAMRGETAQQLEEIKQTCGIDPLSAFDTFYIGLNSARPEEPLVLVRGVERAEAEGCMEKMSKKDGRNFQAERSGVFTTMTTDKGPTMVAWINGNTMIAVPQKADRAYLQDRMAGKNSLLDQPAFSSLAATANRHATAWFAALPADQSPLHQGLASNPLGLMPVGFYGSVDLVNGLSVDLGSRFSSLEEASTAKDKLLPLLEQVKPMIGSAGQKIEIAAADTDVIVSADFDDSDLEQLTMMLAAILGP